MIYFELFYVFFLVGLFTFGGGYAMISILEGEIVSRGWLDTSTFYNVVSISESTPGPIAVNMATFVGNMEGGILGSIVATIGIVLPSFIIILLIATILSKIIENHIVKAILDGFKAVVVGLIFATAFSFLYNNLFLSVEPISIDYIALIFKHAPEGHLLYDENTWTDQNLEFRVSEIIREKAMNSVTQEIPYAIMVEVADLEYNQEENKVWVRAFITVERESQKGIMVGKGGENIKKIRVAAFKEIKKIFPESKLELDLRVRVNGKWKSNDMILSKVFRETRD